MYVVLLAWKSPCCVCHLQGYSYIQFNSLNFERSQSVGSVGEKGRRRIRTGARDGLGQVDVVFPVSVARLFRIHPFHLSDSTRGSMW